MTTVLKTAPKAAKTTTKRVTAPKVKPFSLVAYIAAAVAERLAKPYYKSAMAYHKKAETVFPRQRLDEVRKSLTKEEADAVFLKHDKRVLASGDARGQACFDIYMMSLKK